MTRSWPRRLRPGGQESAHLLLSLLEEEPEALVFADPGRQLPLALLPRLLQLALQLPQHVQLSVQPGLSRPRHLQVQLQVQRSPQEAVQTLDGQRRLKRESDMEKIGLSPLNSSGPTSSAPSWGEEGEGKRS